MRFRNTLIVLVLLVVAGGIAYWTQSHLPTKSSKYLLDVKPEDITRITLKYPGRTIVVARAKDGKWDLVEPIKVPADANAIATLTTEIAHCSIKRVVEEHPKDLANFGLLHPQTTILAETAKGPLPAIEVGKSTPVGYNIYIKAANKPAVLLTAAEFGPGTNRSVDDLRDRTLLKFNVAQVHKVTIDRAGSPEIELDREQGKWRITKPTAYAADSFTVEQFLSALSNARVNEFINDHPKEVAQYGLNKPRIRIAIYTGKGNARESLVVGSQIIKAGQEGFYVQRGESPAVYTIHNWLFADIDKSLNDLRDKTVFAFEPSKVEKIKLAESGNTFVVSRQAKGKWRDTGSIEGEVDPIKVEQFMDHLRTLRANSIVEDSPTDLGKFGLNRPTLAITLIGKDGKELGWARFARIARHNENSKGQMMKAAQRVDYYAMSSRQPTLYALYDYDYNDLAKTAKALQIVSTSEHKTKPASAAVPSAGKS